MEPRPILLVADAHAIENMKLHGHAEAVIVREGYLVMHCDPSQLDMFRVLAPHPFTSDDVLVLRSLHLQNAGFGDTMAKIESIAARIEELL